MKKIVVSILALALVGSFAFADDALTLPKGVFRITTALSFVNGDQTYDVDGDSQDIDAISVTNIGAALEYGVNDWISAAFQWAPGYNVASSIDGSDALLNGPFDIFAGAKIQVVGAKAPVQNDTIRVAFAPGVNIPLPGADFEEEATNAGAGDDFIVVNADKHVIGLGLRAYGDYVINKMFFLNLFGEFIYYPIAANYDEVDLTNYVTAATMEAMSLSPPDEVEYGYDLKLEAEPHFEYMVSEGMRLGISLPVTYKMSPEISIDGDSVDDSDSYSLSLGPNASMFFMKSLVPFELKLAYIFPVMGKNETALNTISIQAKVYLKF